MAIAQNVFSNKIVQGVTASVPGVGPHTIIGAGATNLQGALNSEQYSQVLVVFMNALKASFIVPIPLAALAFFLALTLTKNMRIKGGIKLAGMA